MPFANRRCRGGASYAVAGADPAAIARQVEAQVPDLEDD